MTNTQFAKFAEALALIHGELVAIRVSCERAESRAQGASSTEAYEDALARADVLESGARFIPPDPPPAPEQCKPIVVDTPAPRGKRGRK